MSGAKLMIVIDNVDEVEKELELIGDGINEDVTIPSIMISQYDGKQLMQYLDMARKKDKDVGLVLSVTFPKMAHRLNTHVEAWVSSSDYRSMRTADLLMTSY